MNLNELCRRAGECHSQGRVVEAERLYREVLRSDPANTDVLHGLGVVCLQTGRPEPAARYLRQALASGHPTATMFNNLGVALSTMRRFDEAADVYCQALVIEPEAIATHINLAAALMAAGRPMDALEKLASADARFPGKIELVMAHADIALRAGFYEQAAEAFARAAELQPDLAAAHCGRGEALGACDRHEAAVICFERALELAPDSAVAHYNYGSALTFLGRLDAAVGAFEAAVRLAPEVPSYRYALMALKPVERDDPNLAALERMAHMARQYPAWEQAELHIALAQAYDGLGQAERAFAHYVRGNVIKRGLVTYDEATELWRLREIATHFTREFLEKNAAQGNPDPRPVFVIGMPRSGTSLVEQILASHPAMFGAGEQTILSDLVGNGFPTAVIDWHAAGVAYCDRLTALAPDAERIVDKLPGNFVFAGLIQLALPNARIIHVRRDPLDTCFSCFSKLFAGAVDYSYDLGELGRYYQGYAALMAHWRDVLDPQIFLEVHYEALINDLESEARRMIAHCGLAWDARCLDFHNTRRAVRTASAAQVRRPLYQTSIGRAAAYREWLEPLAAALAS
jgi:tetratricopeptide (TPR) repeat protein